MTISVDEYVAWAPSVDVDRATLLQLAAICGTGKRTVLLGFTDYAKHLINMFHANVVGVLDWREAYHGIRFRDVEVMPVTARDCEQYLVCDYHELLTFKRALYGQCVRERIGFEFAAQYGKSASAVIDFAAQDPLYREIFDPSRHRPGTMMSEAGLCFLLEMLRSCVTLPGAIAEVGAWQGGSAWHFATLLELAGSDKDLFVMELGEGLSPENPQGIVSHGQMQADLAFYEHAQCIFGPINETMQTLKDQEFAYVFLDFGYSPTILDFFFGRLVVGGALVLDNYGHTRGHPDLFDSYFEQHGQTAVRLYKSPVAFVVKR